MIKKSQNKPADTHRDNLKKYAQFTGIAFQMIAIICLFSFFGVWLDGKFPNEYSAYTLIFSLLGVTISMYLVIKQVIDMNKDK